MFKHAIVRRPSRSMLSGITTSSYLGKPDFDNALRQHDEYIKTLEKTGVTVEVLEAVEEYPDSCFVEDVAVLTPKGAVITNPGAPTRKGEVELIISTIKQYYDDKDIYRITNPGTVEGGDVMMVGERFYIGKSKRTNEEGIKQFTKILEGMGYSVVAVPVNKILHLKTGVDYIGNNNMLVSGEFIGMDIFESYENHIIDDNEAYAVNSLLMNDKIIVPYGFPSTLEMIQKLGYETLVCDSSEFRKIDGGLSCLSLRF